MLRTKRKPSARLPHSLLLCMERVPPVIRVRACASLLRIRRGYEAGRSIWRLLGGATDEHADMSYEFVDRASLSRRAYLDRKDGLADHRVAGAAIDSTPAPWTSWWTAIPFW
jgi:hypothetical protein